MILNVCLCLLRFVQFFYENGFVVLRDVISPDHLSKLQAAWMHIESEELPKFMEARSHGIGISRHSFHHMEDGHDNVGRKITGFPFERLMALEPSAALDPLDNPVRTACRTAPSTACSTAHVRCCTHMPYAFVPWTGDVGSSFAHSRGP